MFPSILRNLSVRKYSHHVTFIFLNQRVKILEIDRKINCKNSKFYDEILNAR